LSFATARAIDVRFLTPSTASLRIVKDVTTMSGFEDPIYFSRVFRRFFGASPTEFRTTGMRAATNCPTAAERRSDAGLVHLPAFSGRFPVIRPTAI
jgi:AraC-like DNA-binding protein